MKVLLLNGSPRPAGCTYTALREVADALEHAGVETEIMHADPAATGCTGCRSCGKTEGNLCVNNADNVNEAILKIQECDGFVIGSPVYFGSASGSFTSFLDRLFFAGSRHFAHKPGAAVASCRRAGSTATLDQLNKYITFGNMIVVASQYWNMVHGHTPDEVRQDLEGMQTMRVLGRNMAWLLKSIEAGRAAGLANPEREPRLTTNYIR